MADVERRIYYYRVIMNDDAEFARTSQHKKGTWMSSWAYCWRMRLWMWAAIGSAVAIGAGALALVFFNEASTPPPRSAAGAAVDRAARASREDCSTRSEANFPGAFTSSRNLVVGPLVLIGGAYTDPRTVREFGGNKFPLLVKAGHSVTVRLARSARTSAGLAYGTDGPLTTTKLRDTYDSVTFVACRPGTGPPSGSYADGASVTFWSGFVLTRAPACVPLDIYLDGAPSPRRVGLPLGRRCAQ
jgi:hypothetical protein